MQRRREDPASGVRVVAEGHAQHSVHAAAEREEARQRRMVIGLEEVRHEQVLSVRRHVLALRLAEGLHARHVTQHGW